MNDQENMSPEQQRIAIAKACGWKFYGRNYAEVDLWERQGLVVVDDSSLIGKQQLPNYPEDLNAMHEAEKTLKDRQRDDYAWYLRGLLDSGNTVTQFELAHATSAQRAEAFLRTVGKWKEA